MSSQDELLQIDTPENVVFGYEVAGLGSRFMAALIDYIVIIAGLLLLYLLFFVLVFNSGMEDLGEQADIFGWLIAILILASFILQWGYYIVFEMLWNGQSPGKRLLKLRVIRTDGTPISLVESLIRNLVRLIDFLPITYGIGFVTMFANAQSRRLGDLAAGTLVVFDRSEITLESLQPQPSRPQTPASPTASGEEKMLPDIPVERLTERDIALVEGYLHRCKELANRRQMAQQITETLHKRMGLTYQSMGIAKLEEWLSLVLAAYQQRAR
ncbi:MAG: RDD family protein [Anaerolineae bacterium]|nr:RDD family protein [Anaerolineae bacterium]